MYCLPFGHVGHRRSALRRRHPDRADFFAVRLVVGAQHRAARMLRRRRHLRIAEDDERLGHDQPDAAAAVRSSGCSSLAATGLLRTASGVSPCGTCQTSSPLIEIDRVEHAVRRLEERQTLHDQSAATAAAGGAASAGRRRRCRRRRGRRARRGRRRCRRLRPARRRAAARRPRCRSPGPRARRTAGPPCPAT